MRYKEVKGHLPLAPVLRPYLAPVRAAKERIATMKRQAIYKNGEVNLSDERNGRNSSETSCVTKDPEKAIDTVREIPARTISD